MQGADENTQYRSLMKTMMPEPRRARPRLATQRAKSCMVTAGHPYHA